jgi:hypothetical protein
MIGILIILGFIYLVGGFMWALTYGLNWSDSKGRHGAQDARDQQEAARNFLATPIWPLIAFNRLAKMIGEMKEKV